MTTTIMINTAMTTIATVLSSDCGLTVVDGPPEDSKIILDEKKILNNKKKIFQSQFCCYFFKLSHSPIMPK